MTTEEQEEAAQVAYFRTLIDLEKAGERATISVGPYTAMNLIGALQMVTRHPGIEPPMRKIMRELVNQFRPMFAGTPGEEIINRGDHPEFDK